MGCPQRLRVPVPFDLDEALSTFKVQAMVAARNQGSITLDELSLVAGSGSFALDPDHILIVPVSNGGGKGGVNLREGRNLTVTAWIAPPDQVDVACEQGEMYGPFDVDFDALNEVESVTPAEITLTQNTLELINAGAFSLCLEVVSSVTGTVRIDALTLQLGP